MKHSEELQPRAPGQSDIRGGGTHDRDQGPQKPPGKKCCGGGDADESKS